MSYDLESLRTELSAKNAADEGLVAMAQDTNGGGFFGSLLAERSTKKFVVSKMGNKILVIPYNYDEIEYKHGVGFEKSVIKYAKVSGDGIFALSKLKIWTRDNKLHTYLITQGRGAIKEILKIMDIRAPQRNETRFIEK